jgi:hypothetical protein
MLASLRLRKCMQHLKANVRQTTAIGTVGHVKVAVVPILAISQLVVAWNDLRTSRDAILCLKPDALGLANKKPASESQKVLRTMGCFKSQAGVSVKLLKVNESGAWQVRYYPPGISRGVMFWGLSSAFLGFA